MKVLHLSASDIGGGAARSAYRLHLGLRDAGVDSEMLVLHRRSSDPSVRVFPVNHSLAQRIPRRLWRFWQGAFAASHRPLGVRSLEIFSTDGSPFGDAVLRSIESADVVSLHWVAGMFEFSALAELTRRVPVVWTLHDMNPFTGGCHFDAGCGRFSAGCGCCPQLESNSVHDRSARVLERKTRTTGRIEPGRLTIACPSRWLAAQSRASRVFSQFEAVHIPYGLETDVFQPRDPRVIRELTGIPAEARVVLFLAEGLGNRRKGFDLLIEALRQLGDLENTWLLAVGGGSDVEGADLPLPVRTISTVSNDRFLSFVYSAADLFIMASRADNLPNTVLESLSCGTPVIGFDVGGVPDVVIPGETGALAVAGDTGELAAAMRGLLEDDDLRRRMQLMCRERAKEELALKVQAERYQELYVRLLDSPRMSHVREVRPESTIAR